MPINTVDCKVSPLTLTAPAQLSCSFFYWARKRRHFGYSLGNVESKQIAAGPLLGNKMEPMRCVMSCFPYLKTYFWLLSPLEKVHTFAHTHTPAKAVLYAICDTFTFNGNCTVTQHRLDHSNVLSPYIIAISCNCFCLIWENRIFHHFRKSNGSNAAVAGSLLSVAMENNH